MSAELYAKPLPLKNGSTGNNKNPVSYKGVRDIFNFKLLVVLLSAVVVPLLGSASRGNIYYMILLVWNNLSGTEQENPKSVAYLFKDVHYYVIISIVSSFAVFYGLGGFLQWYYYIMQRDKPQEWKCQPNRFLTKENERHEILAGSRNMLLGSTVSGFMTAYVSNGGTFFKIYYNVGDRGWLYFIISTIVVFLFQDGSAYYAHRYFHTPWFYKNIHKHHHRYHSPTAFGAVAMHPLEQSILQFLLIFPIMVAPVHYLTFIGCTMYIYYYGMIDHSGIDLQAIWPWQPPVRFHDDHHKYFHVNFGFNTLIFDRFHDTLRKKDRKYGEEIFGGKGISKTKENGYS